MCNEIISIIISIHALREEGDTSRKAMRTCSSYFYPRPPRGGRRAEVQLSLADRDISIHALREEGDQLDEVDALVLQEISIHALREEGDARGRRCGRWFQRFLSTPSARRATGGFSQKYFLQIYFYPRPPRGGRPAKAWCR